MVRISSPGREGKGGDSERGSGNVPDRRKQGPRGRSVPGVLEEQQAQVCPERGTVVGGEVREEKGTGLRGPCGNFFLWLLGQRWTAGTKPSAESTSRRLRAPTVTQPVEA